MTKVQPGIYLHYKGNLYRVLTVAKHTENDEEMVIYHPMNNPESLWARPSSIFTDMLLHNNQLTSRFRFIRRDDTSSNSFEIKTTESIC